MRVIECLFCLVQSVITSKCVNYKLYPFYKLDKSMEWRQHLWRNHRFAKKMMANDSCLNALSKLIPSLKFDGCIMTVMSMMAVDTRFVNLELFAWIIKLTRISSLQLSVQKDGPEYFSALEIKNVTVEDAGKYKVTAKNELGESNATITLNFDSKFLLSSFFTPLFDTDIKKHKEFALFKFLNKFHFPIRHRTHRWKLRNNNLLMI